MRNKKLAKEILRMAKLDQRARKTYLKNNRGAFREVKKIDEANLVKMKKIVREFGWPTISLVGKRASHLAWLLVQHGDSDINFQKYCLKLMKKAVRNRNVNLANIAFLSDRILVNQGKPQIYGTQFYKDKEGSLFPRPIKDIQNLDKRRKKMGLGNLTVYKKRMVNKR